MSHVTENSLGFVHHFEPSPTGGAHTLLLLHGTGGDENDLLGLGRQLAPQAALLSPRGKVLENGAPRFFRRLREGVFDLQDLQYRANELANFIQAASAEYNLDPDRICALGFSNGANIAAALMLLRPQQLRYAALLRPMVPLHPPQAPDLSKHQVLIAAGSNDPMVSPEQTADLVQLLKGYGASVQMNIANAGHNLTTTDLSAVAQWLNAKDGFLKW